MKKILALLLALVLTMSMLAACGNKDNSAGGDTPEATEPQGEEPTDAPEDTDEETEPADGGSDDDTVYEIGILQLVQHDALDKANQGFLDALTAAGINFNVDQQNAQGEPSTADLIASQFVSADKDLVYAIATPAAQSMAANTSDIPVVFSAVTDPVGAELVDSLDVPGGNITGASDLASIEDQVGLIMRMIPDAKKVGILYNSAEQNSEYQAKLAMEACDAFGLEGKTYTVSSLNEIEAVVASMASEIDVMYVPTDNMIASGMATVGMIAIEHKLPIIAGEEGMITAGALATYGINYYELGKLAGEQAVQILKEGKSPAEIPVVTLPEEGYEVVINKEFAESIEFEIPEEFLD